MSIRLLVVAYAVLGTLGLIAVAIIVWLVWRSSQAKPPGK